MDARLLDRRLLAEPAQIQAQPFAMPQPAPAPLDDPTAYQVKPGPVGAQFLAPEEMEAPPASAPASAPAPPPAAALAQPQGGGQPASPWTAERKAFADKVNQTARRHRQMVEQRRAARQAMSAYTKLHSQLEGTAGTLKDLQSMEQTYKDIYTPDSPATMALQKQQAHHFEKLSRLRSELTQHAQRLNKQFGMPLDKNGVLKDLDQYQAQSDQSYDDEIRQGALDAYSTVPPQ